MNWFRCRLRCGNARVVPLLALILGGTGMHGVMAEEPEQLEKRLQHLEEANKALTREVSALKSETRPADSLSSVAAGFHPGGGGFYIQGEQAKLRLLGYAQAVGSFSDGSLGRNEDFSVRRARINFLADFFEDYQLFIELDGAPSARTALVEARLNWRIRDDALQLRAGKFTSQFSRENARSSRSIDTIERFMALNSMFLLPGLDSQFGLMAHGRVLEERSLGWSLGVYNGNGSANANVRDDNSSKEVQAKVDYDFTPNLNAGLAFDYSREEEQTLSLADLAFNRFVSVPVTGDRYGVGGDVFWENGPLSLRSEWLYFQFDSDIESDVSLWGGFVQPAWFLTGHRSGGLQLLVRGEVAVLDASQQRRDTSSVDGAPPFEVVQFTGGDTLYAVTLGANWFVNPNVELKINGIFSYFDGASEERGFAGSRWNQMLLTQLQFKF